MPTIILAMHGAPPKDFPPHETIEFFNLHARLEHQEDGESKVLRERFEQLHSKMRAWPRTPNNDPFHAGSLELAQRLQEATQKKVILGFNEFCSPSLEEAFQQAMQHNPRKIIVITPMMTRGGEHSEVEIPASINEFKERYPNILIEYVWPLEPSHVANFLASQIAWFESK
jgi:sirohydrochlorin cobaltochelatase